MTDPPVYGEPVFLFYYITQRVIFCLQKSIVDLIMTSLFINHYFTYPNFVDKKNMVIINKGMI